MNKNRRREGDETYDRLLNWTKDQKSAERLAGQILKIEEFESIDPSHPLGGPDGIKDLICKREGKKYIVSVYFSRRKQSFNRTKTKFQLDYKGVRKNKGDGFVFITNQKLTISDRDTLKQNKKKIIEIYHLERLTSIMNCPISYGIRLEYLDIQLSKEEQLSYFAVKDKQISEFNAKLKEILDYLNKPTIKKSIPRQDLNEFKNLLDSIVGPNIPNPILASPNISSLYGIAPIDKLRVPIEELKEFEKIMMRIVGNNLPQYFDNPIGYLSTISGYYRQTSTPIQKLHVPINRSLQINS